MAQMHSIPSNVSCQRQGRLLQNAKAITDLTCAASVKCVSERDKPVIIISGQQLQPSPKKCNCRSLAVRLCLSLACPRTRIPRQVERDWLKWAQHGCLDRLAKTP